MIAKKGSSFFRLFEKKKDPCQTTQEQPTTCTIPLSEATCGGKVRVCKVDGARKTCARMAQLGVLPGCELELLCPCQGHNCMIKIKGGAISLDLDSAQSILVMPA